MSHKEQPTMINCAMNMGAVVGIYYIVKFCLFPLSLTSTMAAMLFLGLTLVVPYLVYMLTKRYRDQYLGGTVDFSHAYLFAALTMGFGSLLVAVAHYIYFAYIDGGAIMNAFSQSIEQLQEMIPLLSAPLEDSAGATSADALPQSSEMEQSIHDYISMMQQTAKQLQAMSPIDITIGMLSNNFSWGIIVSLPIALIVSLHKVQRQKSNS